MIVLRTTRGWLKSLIQRSSQSHDIPAILIARRREREYCESKKSLRAAHGPTTYSGKEHYSCTNTLRRDEVKKVCIRFHNNFASGTLNR